MVKNEIIFIILTIVYFSTIFIFNIFLTDLLSQTINFHIVLALVELIAYAVFILKKYQNKTYAIAGTIFLLGSYIAIFFFVTSLVEQINRNL